MGQFCSGGSGPDLDVNADRITEMINESLEGVEAEVKAAVEGIAEDLGDEEFNAGVDSAISDAFGKVDQEELKGNIWKEVDAHLDKQIEAMEEEKRPAKEEIEGSKKDIKERDVDQAVDSQFKDKEAELKNTYQRAAAKEEEEQKDDEKDAAKEDEAAKEDDAAGDDKAADDAAKDEAAKEDAAADDKPADDKAAADDAAADEPAADEAAKDAADEPAADEPAADEAAADDAGGDDE